MPEQLSLIPAPPGTSGGLATWNEYDKAMQRRLKKADAGELPAIKEVTERHYRIACELGDAEAVTETSIAARRTDRAIGLRNPRRKPGRPKSGANKNRPADGTNTPAALPRSTVARHRKDAEGLTDEGFEKAATAAREARRPLTPAAVRLAGETERAGGDPAAAVTDPAPKPKPLRSTRAGIPDDPDLIPGWKRDVLFRYANADPAGKKLIAAAIKEVHEAILDDMTEAASK